MWEKAFSLYTQEIVAKMKALIIQPFRKTDRSESLYSDNSYLGGTEATMPWFRLAFSLRSTLKAHIEFAETWHRQSPTLLELLRLDTEF